MYLSKRYILYLCIYVCICECIYFKMRFIQKIVGNEVLIQNVPVETLKCHR